MAGDIVHIIWELEIGGAERALFQLVREQRRRGVVADVIVGSTAGYYGERARAEGATVYELGQKHTLDMSAAANATSILKSYSVAHFHSAELGLIHLASRQPELRRYYTHRAGVFSYPLKQAIRYRVAGHYFRRHFAGISGNTRQGAAAASRLFKIPIESIPSTYNGIDFSLLDPKISRDEALCQLGNNASDIVRIGTSANLRPWKRTERLIEAVAKLRNPKVQCVIIGDGPSRNDLEMLSQRLGIADQVIFTGQKDHVGDYLQVLDIFVLPSGPEESFGNSAVEGMGVGLPVIIFSDGGGLTEHIVDSTTGYIVDDTDGLYRRLAELVANPALRRQIGGAARTAIREKYSLDAMVDRYSRFYGM